MISAFDLLFSIKTMQLSPISQLSQLSQMDFAGIYVNIFKGVLLFCIFLSLLSINSHMYKLYKRYKRNEKEKRNKKSSDNRSKNCGFQFLELSDVENIFKPRNENTKESNNTKDSNFNTKTQNKFNDSEESDHSTIDTVYENVCYEEFNIESENSTENDENSTENDKNSVENSTENSTKDDACSIKDNETDTEKCTIDLIDNLNIFKNLIAYAKYENPSKLEREGF